MQQPIRHTMARAPQAATWRDRTTSICVFLKKQARERKETKLQPLGRTFHARHEDTTRCEQPPFLNAAPEVDTICTSFGCLGEGWRHSGRVLTQNAGCYTNETCRYARFAATQNFPSTQFDRTSSIRSVVGTATYYPMNGPWCEYRQTQKFSSH